MADVIVMERWVLGIEIAGRRYAALTITAKGQEIYVAYMRNDGFPEVHYSYHASGLGCPGDRRVVCLFPFV
jgi:hypothetical protein